jgi:hypothetical protein
MSIKSINEPAGPGRTTMLLPASINEPPDLNMPEAPVITSIDPEDCVIGEADFTLFITGTGFYPASIIHFAGHDEPTTLNEDGTLSTGVKPSLWGAPVVVQCQVANGEVMSNAVDFTFAGVAAATEGVDPDDLEDEIDEAIEEGDVTVHRRKRKR